MVREKLVRDLIPSIIEESKQNIKVRVVAGDELDAFLRAKIVEEAKELEESGSIVEIADIIEAVEALLRLRGVSWDTIRGIQYSKRSERGGFNSGIVLEMPDGP